MTHHKQWTIYLPFEEFWYNSVSTAIKQIVTLVTLTWVACTFQILCTANTVSWKKYVQPNMTLHTLTAIFFKRILHLSGWNSASWVRLLQNSVQARWITALRQVSSSLGPSMAIKPFDQCPVRSQPFAGTRRFLAGLLTFPSRRPIVYQLRARGRKWFRTSAMTTQVGGLLSTSSELGEGNGSELVRWLHK